MSKAKDFLVAVGLLLVGRRRPKLTDDREPIVPPAPASSGSELAVIVLLFVGALLAVGFVVFYAVDSLPKQTQLLGASLGLSLLCFAAALILTAHRLVVTEEIEDDYPEPEHPHEQETIMHVVEDSGSRLTRRRLFKAALGAAGGALGLALITPAASLGPFLQMKSFYATTWRRGRRLVDEKGRPWQASDIEENDFYTAFPEGADKEALASAVVLVRLPKDAFDLPPDLRGYPADGIVAYSKVCTHAGCAISLYRAPLFPPADPKPALVCPCHYSTFDPARAGKVLFGPAGRNLPMLPLEIGAGGELRAAGTFNQPVGPSWWGVRNRKAKPA